jgi:uncharacterized protein with ParB-like and HNH nuclease domain
VAIALDISEQIVNKESGIVKVDGWRLFETLNDRGKRVSQSDFVKNYLFGAAGEERLPEVQLNWTTTQPDDRRR